MGRGIVYCGDCGRSLREDAFERGLAGWFQDVPYCSACRAPSPTPPTGAIQKVRRPSSGQLPAATPRRPLPASRPRSKAPLLIGASLAVAAVLLLALFALSGPGSHPKPAASKADDTRKKAVETPARAAPPIDRPAGEATDRYLGMIRELRGRDVDFRKRREVKNLIDATRRQAGPRAGELDRLEAEYDRSFEDAAKAAADAAASEARGLAAKGRTEEALARLEELPAAFAETGAVRGLGALREELLRKPVPAPTAPGGGGTSIVLPASTARLNSGGALTLKKNEYLGNWHTDGDRAEWLAAPPAGRWKVELVYAADPAAGGTLVLTLGGATLEWGVVSTGGFTRYATVELGAVSLPGGATPVVAKGRGTRREGLLNLRELRLTPLP
jgi:hypothetical protein